jgi:hypothetical protein
VAAETLNSLSETDITASDDSDESFHQDTILSILHDAVADTLSENQHEDQGEDQEDEGPGASSATGNMLPPPRCRSPSFLYNDASEEVQHKRSFNNLDNFTMLLGFWCEEAGISRRQYSALLQILETLKDIKTIQHLPRSLDTLKCHLKGQFPMLPVRRVKVTVLPDKMPTLSSAERQLAQSTARWMYFKDPISLIFRMLQSSAFQRKMHRGMAHFTDQPGELWESWPWGSSIRTTSGEFAEYPNGDPIFPSDFIYYRCENSSCPCVYNSKQHLGRVQCVGKDFTTRAFYPGAVTLQIQELIQERGATASLRKLLEESGPPLQTNELVLHDEAHIFLLPSSIRDQEPNIFLDYQFQNGHSQSYICPINKFLVRRVINGPATQVYPLNRTTPSRGELEITTYGREKLIRVFQKEKCISIPYQLFIDGFGLYRSVYRSLMGIYLIPACLQASERAKISNVYPLTLGPHGSNFPDVISSLTGLTALDQGMELDITGTGQRVRISAFCLAFLGDMPQQQDNAGFKRPTAVRSCRQCLVTEENRGNLDFDIVRMGRYHHQTLYIRNVADHKPRTAREQLCRKYGF